MCISIVDYGMGNLRSVQKGFEKIGSETRIIQTAREVADARALVLPGVGAFKKCLTNLEAQKLSTPIVRAIESGKPFMGICLGLQILFSESVEFGTTPGLDVIRGKVVRFPQDNDSSRKMKIPHMGWNSITLHGAPPVLAGIQSGAYVYFVHSFYVVPDEAKLAATTTTYGVEFVSSIWRDNIFACQFHPEKSQSLGLRILKNFAQFARENS